MSIHFGITPMETPTTSPSNGHSPHARRKKRYYGSPCPLKQFHYILGPFNLGARQCSQACREKKLAPTQDGSTLLTNMAVGILVAGE